MVLLTISKMDQVGYFRELITSVPAGFVGGIFCLVSILLLTVYLLVEAQDVFNVFVRLFPRTHLLSSRCTK